LKLETRNQKATSRREQVILYAPLFIWIGVIFFLSSGQGASTRTSVIVRPILEFLFPAATDETLQFYHGVIRKCAHLTEYAILGFWTCRAFVRSRSNFLKDYFYLTAAVLVLMVAGIDEFNQSFNPDRTGAVLDVALDLSGGLTAIFIYWLVRGRRHSPAPSD
jgi:VanZ family protein